MTYARARKTVPVQPLLDYANGYLAAKGGTPDARKAIIAFIESVLFKADRYRGFTYLTEDQLAAADLPGIRWDKKDYFDNTDKTRRRYV
jgi:hypothetical protein